MFWWCWWRIAYCWWYGSWLYYSIAIISIRIDDRKHRNSSWMILIVVTKTGGVGTEWDNRGERKRKTRGVYGLRLHGARPRRPHWLRWGGPLPRGTRPLSLSSLSLSSLSLSSLPLFSLFSFLFSFLLLWYLGIFVCFHSNLFLSFTHLFPYFVTWKKKLITIIWHFIFLWFKFYFLIFCIILLSLFFCLKWKQFWKEYKNPYKKCIIVFLFVIFHSCHFVVLQWYCW